MVRPFNPLNPLLHLSLRIVVPIVERVRNAVLQLHKLNMAAVSLSLKVEKADRLFSASSHMASAETGRFATVGLCVRGRQVRSGAACTPMGLR